MPRKVFPDDRVIYGPAANGQPLLSRAGIGVTFYTDEAATTLADITDMADVEIPFSRLIVASDTRMPLFKGPNDDTNSLYFKTDGSSTVEPIWARVDDQIDSLLAADTAEVAARNAAIALEATARSTADIAALSAAELRYPIRVPNDVDGNGRRIPPTGHLNDFRLNTAPVAPPGMSWLPFTVLGRKSDGDVAVSKSPQQTLDTIVSLPNAVVSPVYVDATIGDDAHSGINLGNPHKTIAPGLLLGVYRHYIGAGNYPDVMDVRSDQTSGNRVRRFYGSTNPVGQSNITDATKYTILRATGDQPTALTWSLVGGGGLTYQATLPGLNTPARVLIALRPDELGRPGPIPKQASVAAINTAGVGWFFDSGTRVLSVRYGNMVDAATFTSTLAPHLSIIYRAPANYYSRLYGGQAYYENIVFLGVYPWLLSDATRPSPIGVFKNCVFAYSDTSAVVVQSGKFYAYDSEIYRCNADGINSHVVAGQAEADHVLINCKSWFVGDTDTFGEAGVQNKNHASMHESGRSAILGLKGNYSFGPGLIDTGEVGGTGVSWWYGCDISESYGTNANYETYGVAGGAPGVRTTWMDQCSENGDTSSAPLVSSLGAVLRYGANATRTPVATSNGVALPYDPKLPL